MAVGSHIEILDRGALLIYIKILNDLCTVASLYFLDILKAGTCSI